jgi:hypothetical protein
MIKSRYHPERNPKSDQRAQLERLSEVTKKNTDDLFPNISLNDNLIQPLRVLTDTRTRGETIGKELGRLFQVDREGFESVDGGKGFTFRSLFPFDRHFCSLSDSEIKNKGEINKRDMVQ